MQDNPYASPTPVQQDAAQSPASDAIELQGIYSQRDYTSAFRLYYGWKRWYASLDKIVYLCVAVAVLKVAIDIQAIVPGSLLSRQIVILLVCSGAIYLTIVGKGYHLRRSVKNAVASVEEVQVRIDDAGIEVTTPNKKSENYWRGFASYRHNDEMLIVNFRSPVGVFQVIPVRFLSASDWARLKALVASKLPRI